MKDYYSRLERLRFRLVEAGEDAFAIELLAAERSATTSGEALTMTGEVLRQLLDEPRLTDLELRTEIQRIYDAGGALWEGREPRTLDPE